MSKQLLGQFYTTTDPFSISDAFSSWYQLVPNNTTILEPFAGAGHLFSYVDANWDGFDLEPNHPNVAQRDTIKDFPRGYRVCITNPPYLAKTVVSRKKLPVVLNHEDLYLDALQQCLDHCDYVAAIIPSTFWNQNLFKDRLYAWDKFDMELFSDTDNPAGVAYFVPNKVNRTRTFINGKEVYLNASNTPITINFPMTFNPEGLSPYLVNGIDTVEKNNIHIRKIDGFDISSIVDNDGKCKSTNRNMFPIECEYLKDEDIPAINKMIDDWREETQDFYLTSFKSCKKDGKYRKRISFKEVRWILCNYYNAGPLKVHQ
jgi:hypothetical protein